jgi:hypothetical protein
MSFTPSLIQKQVFTLSWLSGQSSGGNAGRPWHKDDLQNAINKLPKPFSNWKVVWGPNYTLADLNLAASNAMYVAQQQDDAGNPLPVYVVATAGTNSSSLYDLLDEDLDIDSTEWKLEGNGPSVLKVTTGDMDGLKNLIGMGWPFNDIREYLASIQKPDVTLWFTGHSLGGALSPMLMTALMDPYSALDTKKTQLGLWKQVNLLATAGPSIGNQEFVDYFRKLFSASNATTTFVWNANDVVPHAWASSSMQALTSPKNIYGLTFAPGSKIAALLAKQQANAGKQAYVQFQPDAAFQFALQPYTNSTNSPESWNPDSEFVAQLGYQHLNAYVKQFGCDYFVLPNPCDDPAAANKFAKLLGG